MPESDSVGAAETLCVCVGLTVPDRDAAWDWLGVNVRLGDCVCEGVGVRDGVDDRLPVADELGVDDELPVGVELAVAATELLCV